MRIEHGVDAAGVTEDERNLDFGEDDGIGSEGGYVPAGAVSVRGFQRF